jgi:hypothetical protein
MCGRVFVHDHAGLWKEAAYFRSNPSRTPFLASRTRQIQGFNAIGDGIPVY